MEFLQITDAENHLAKEIFDIYSKTFPADERRDESQFRELFSEPNAKIFSVLDSPKNIGYLICWQLPDFVFIEHFEVFNEFRSQNFGSKILAHLQKTQTRIVLEAEPGTQDETAARRINFYKKNGFTVIDEAYLQPSYGNGKSTVNLWLLANWMPEKTELIREEIYDTVYG